MIYRRDIKIKTPSRCGRARDGFTLMELIIVVAIIAVVVAATVPIVSALLRGSSVKQTQNMVTAYLASARATALSAHTPVALVFFTDHNPALRAPRPAVQLVEQVSFPASPWEAHFVAIPDRPPEYLPEGIDVVVLSDMLGEIQSDNSQRHCRAVLFAADGQLLVRSGLVGANPDWNMNGGAPTAANPNASSINGTSSPGVIVYDARELSTRGLTGSAAEDWILKNGNALLVNAYTGNVIR